MHIQGSKLHIWTLSVGLALVLGFANGGVYAKQNKVDVCHMSANGSYHHLSIAEPAYQAHNDHGDSSPGDIVPGASDYSFADDCTFIPACPCTVDLPSGWQAFSGASGQGIEICADGSVVRSTFGFWDGGARLNHSETQRCDGPTLFSCSAGGNQRDISEAQYEVCIATTSVP